MWKSLGGEVRTLWRIVHHNLTEFRNKRCCLVGHMWTRIVLMKANSFGQQPSSFVLDSSLKFSQSLAVPIGVYGCSTGQLIDQ